MILFYSLIYLQGEISGLLPFQHDAARLQPKVAAGAVADPRGDVDDGDIIVVVFIFSFFFFLVRVRKAAPLRWGLRKRARGRERAREVPATGLDR